jgi:2-methylisocitrate lyase-like PEP mutase family enzyme
VSALTAAARRFRAAHHGQQPLVLPNVWDCASARVFAEAGFGALATSSGAVAATLGYADGQRTPVAEMLAAIARIARCVDVPVTADVEAGYGLAPAELAARLAEAGAVGCNLEDSDPAARELGDPGRQADFLAAVREAAGDALVINARVDVFVRPRPAGAGPDGTAADADGAGADGAGAGAAADQAVADAAERGRRYLEAGADCCYPILAPLAALPTLVAEIGGPVNAMCWPGGPSLAELAATGVARITFGSSLHHSATEALAATARTLHAEL